MAYISKPFVNAFRIQMKGTKSSPWPKQIVDIQYGKPNYWNEWSEIKDPKQRKVHSVYQDFYELGKNESASKLLWIDLVKKGRMEKVTIAKAKKIDNTEAGIANSFKKLNKTKQNRALAQIVSGKLELPIVANYGDYRFLVAGNTRLVAQMELFGEAWVWQFNVVEEFAGEKAVVKGKKPSVKISTAQQEQITLRVVQQVLNKDSKDWKTFEDMYDDPKSGLKKIHPKLKVKPLELNDWWQNFNVQFNEIKFNNTNLKNNHYEVFNHDGKGVSDTGYDFMQYISDLITKGPPTGTGIKWKAAELAMFAKKDSWNPADIWLLDTKGNPKGTYDKVKKELEAAQSIMEVNFIMQQAFHNRIIKGISLKKNPGKPGSLKYDEVNLYDTKKDQPLPKVTIKEIQFDPHFDWNGKTGTKTFSSVTGLLIFQEQNSSSLYNLSFRSNRTKLIDITYEFKQQGGSAQLGKIPKDRFLAELLNQGITSGFPGKADHGSEATSNMKQSAKSKNWDSMKGHWTKARHKVVSDFLKSHPWSVGDQTDLYKMSFAEWKKSSELKGPAAQVEYKKQKAARVAENKEAAWKAFETNLEMSIKKHGIIKGNGIMMQMVDFLYLFAKLKKQMGDTAFRNFMTNLFYWAQKKGQKWYFGPFGKMA